MIVTLYNKMLLLVLIWLWCYSLLSFRYFCRRHV